MLDRTHPASKYIPLLLCCTFFAWLLSLIAIFVPWAWKDTAVGERTQAGLWKSCRRYPGQPLSPYTCWENDVDQVGSISGGDMKCRGYIVATQVFTVAAVCFTFLTLLLAAYIAGKMWGKPIVLGLYLAMLSVLAFGCCLVSFLMWIVYSRQICQFGNPLFPMAGYSWGWICMVVATFFSGLAMLLAYLALWAILRFKPMVTAAQPAPTPLPMYMPGSVAPSPSPVGMSYMAAEPPMMVAAPYMSSATMVQYT